MKKFSLEACRKNEDLTQEQLAKKLKVTRNTIINWENGEVKVPQVARVAISSVLDTELDIIDFDRKIKKQKVKKNNKKY